MAASQPRVCASSCAAFDADRALADGRQHLVLGHRRADMLEAEPLQARPAPAGSPRPRRPRAWRSRVSTLPRRVTILQVGPAMQELRAPAQRRGADHRALPQVGDALDVARDQHVARILARQEGGDRQARRAAPSACPSCCARRRRCGAASSASSISLTNRPLPPASDSGRSWMASPVVLIDDDLDRIGCGQRRHRPRQRVAHQSGLGEGELAAARAECRRRGAAMALL